MSAFLSSTLLSGGSELVLAAVAQDPDTRVWAIGRVLPERSFKRAGNRGAVERLSRYGSPVLLLSWVPVVGGGLPCALSLRARWLGMLYC